MLSKHRFKFTLQTEGSSPEDLFAETIEDEEFRDGEVGLISYLGKIHYHHIQLMPFKDKPKKQEEAGAPEEEGIEEVKVQGAATKQEI